MPKCPACNTTVEADTTVCPSCGLSLVSPPLTPKLDRTAEGYVVLALFDGHLDAQILEGRLLASGLHPIVLHAEDSYFGTANPGSATPIAVAVSAAEAATALEVIAKDGHWTEEELTRYLSMLDEAPPETMP